MGGGGLRMAVYSEPVFSVKEGAGGIPNEIPNDGGVAPRLGCRGRM